MFEFDRTNLSIDKAIGLLPFDGGSIAAVLYPDCDVAGKFGVNGLKDTDVVFSVIAYADHSFLTAQYSMDTDRGEEYYSYEPTEGETKLFWELLEEFSQKNYGCSLKEYPAWRQCHAQTCHGVTMK